jgi:AraC family transcriptional regulator of adaptative response / DNA-3-methyladenine glycosylase II
VLPAPDACYRALSRRDRRFDGRIFVGVVTTGVFCRPVCPSRTPLRRNVLFFPSAQAAAEAGFRACRRCRPDALPGSPAWRGTRAVVQRALRLIDAGALDAGGVAALAAQVGLGDRQLRRLFRRHLGESPVAVAQRRRALRARRLLESTALPVTEVALRAGFGSIRRFNAALRSAFGAPPRSLRRLAAPAPRPGS